jgi:predicted RNase H-like HicB family nuclease
LDAEVPLEIKAKFERQADGWRVEVPQLGNLVTTAKRLDKATEQIKDLAEAATGEERCDIIVKVEAVMPGIICDLESAQEKSREAARLQEEASNEIRDVVSRMRDEGLTMRDIAVLLGVSPQRVAQLAPCATEMND